MTAVIQWKQRNTAALFQHAHWKWLPSRAGPGVPAPCRQSLLAGLPPSLWRLLQLRRLVWILNLASTRGLNAPRLCPRVLPSCLPLHTPGSCCLEEKQAVCCWEGSQASSESQGPWQPACGFQRETIDLGRWAELGAFKRTAGFFPRKGGTSTSPVFLSVSSVSHMSPCSGCLALWHRPVRLLRC